MKKNVRYDIILCVKLKKLIGGKNEKNRFTRYKCYYV